VVREQLIAFATERGVGEDDLTQFLTAIGEALANAIEHARSEAPIEIDCHISRGQIVATVTDVGIGFSSVGPSAGCLPDVTAERGRGLMIMRSCSDIFDVKSVPGGGTAVRLGRYLRGVGTGAQALLEA
jgi:anti-sigma regulatory factor (Ser/Thr protein kinase)